MIGLGNVRLCWEKIKPFSIAIEVLIHNRSRNRLGRFAANQNQKRLMSLSDALAAHKTAKMAVAIGTRRSDVQAT